MRLLLDEMNSWRIAEQLQRDGYDVVAVKRHRPELEQTHDPTVLGAAASERRGVVTNNVRDYRQEHARFLARGQTHYGIVYTYDDTLPRTRASFPLWIATLTAFLDGHPAEDALLNRAHILQP